MQWNPLVPELNVSDFNRSLQFYVEGVGFSIAFQRTEPAFAYLDLAGAQLMLEADHFEAWVTDDLVGARGRGLNLQIEVPDVRISRRRLMHLGYQPFRELRESWYDVAGGQEGQLEYLVQDPDGFLVRLVEVLDGSPNDRRREP